MTDSAITLSGVSKKYPIYDSPFQRLKEALRGGRKSYHREFWALREISLEIPRGVTLGILGQNGAGKSTLLQVISGIMEPSAGEVNVNGRISTILELGAGFNPDFTGRENAFFSGILLGVEPAEIRKLMNEIVDFAEIGEFIDQPVRTYSTGMYVRLAFAVAITLNPAILLIDEILAVGDAYFYHKCMLKIRQLQEEGKTLVYVTHDVESVRNICHQALILDHSRILAQGAPGEIVDQYMALIDGREQDRLSPATIRKPEPEETAGLKSAFAAYSRHGNRHAEIIGIEILNKNGDEQGRFQGGEEIVIRIQVRFNEDVENFVLGNIFRNRYGLNIYGTNTLWQGMDAPDFRKGEECRVIFRHRAAFATGTYSINPAASAVLGEDSYQTLDWINNAAIIEIYNPEKMEGYVSLPTEIEIEKT